MIPYQQKLNKQSGFALLMTLVVVSVLVSIGLSVLQVSIAQIRLATNTRDSEIAFHAANAGLECARYTRRQFALEMEGDGTGSNPPGEPLPTPQCFDETLGDIDADEILSVGTAEANKYAYEFEWGSAGAERCSKITSIVFVADGDDLTLGDPQTHIPGYTGASVECAEGELCTVLSVQGYNKPCSQITSAGTIQREVLLEF